MSDLLPHETWLSGAFQEELESGEYVLNDLYPKGEVDTARTYWRQQISLGKHVIPGVGIVRAKEGA